MAYVCPIVNQTRGKNTYENVDSFGKSGIMRDCKISPMNIFVFYDGA